MYQGPGTYAHYKGGIYFVLGLATDTETKAEDSVIYIHLKSGKMYRRPLDVFNQLTYKWDQITWEEGKERFIKVEAKVCVGMAVVKSGETCLIFRDEK